MSDQATCATQPKLRLATHREERAQAPTLNPLASTKPGAIQREITMNLYKTQKYRSWAHALSVTALIALLGACGGSSEAPPVDPLASFKQQRLDWQPCDPTILGAEVPFFEPLGDRAQCTLMRAPLDYAHPTRGEVTVALLKVSAGQPKQRAGLILFNPGGPGEDGLFFAPKFGALWTDANPNSASGKALKDLSNRYDLIGFSPRGLGASSRLYCASNELLRPANGPTVDRNEANLSAVLHNTRLQAQACLKNPLTRAISTDATARDMDLVRALAGDERLNYIGYSYGTWLGTWYASLFPERVGRMLLDSSMNVVGSFSDATQLSAMGFDRVFNQIVAPYAARHPDLYGLGSDAEGVRQALQTLPTPLKAWALDKLQLNSSAGIGFGLIGLRAATGLQDLIATHPQAESNDLLLAAETYTFMADSGNDKSTHNAFRELISALAPSMRQSVFVLPKTAVYFSVICNDLPTYGDESFWIGTGNQDAARYPAWGGDVTKNHCLHWGGPSVQRPSISAATQAAPILMLQSRYDGPTPIEGAMVTLEALPNARMIVIENEYSHGLFPYGDDCADPQVGEYFVTGKLPARTSSCPGKPLLGEVATFPAEPPKAVAAGKTALRATLGSAPGPANNTYNNPQRAAEIMRAIHQQVSQAQRGG